MALHTRGWLLDIKSTITQTLFWSRGWILSVFTEHCSVCMCMHALMVIHVMYTWSLLATFCHQLKSPTVSCLNMIHGDTGCWTHSSAAVIDVLQVQLLKNVHAKDPRTFSFGDLAMDVIIIDAAARCRNAREHGAHDLNIGSWAHHSCMSSDQNNSVPPPSSTVDGSTGST